MATTNEPNAPNIDSNAYIKTAHDTIDNVIKINDILAIPHIFPIDFFHFSFALSQNNI